MGNKKKRDSFEALNLAGINLIQFQYEIALKRKRKKKRIRCSAMSWWLMPYGSI